MSINRRQFTLAAAGTAMAPMMNSLSLAAADRPLAPIPAVMDARRGVIPLHIREGKWSFDGRRKVSTWGLSQDYLGPTLLVRRGDFLALQYENQLSEPVAMHGHGLLVKGELDGGPQRAMAPGERWEPVIPIQQEAAMVWYHTHTHNVTGPQVYKGLAGAIVIEDDNSDKLPLPRRYGVDDIPLVVQDKDFHPNGELNYNPLGLGRFYAKHMLVNGVIEPKVRVPRSLVRLRLLNGSNGRFYNFAFADDRTFVHIASDSGFLEQSVETNRLFMGPGERNEILVDFSDGAPAVLRSVKRPRGPGPESYQNFDPVQGEQTICHFQVDRSIAVDGEIRIPSRLNTIERLDPHDARVTRHLKLEDMKINGESMDMAVINHRARKGDIEIWDLEGDLHNFHIHGCAFQVLSINGKTPPPGQMGWKDTVVVDMKAQVIVRFDHTAPDDFPYMYHCHLLEHEDMGMMGQFVVYESQSRLPPREFTAPVDLDSVDFTQ